MAGLFVTQVQGQIFLLLTGCGLGLGLGLQLLTRLRGRCPRLRGVADALFALLMGLSLLAVLLRMRESALRLYALLGLTVGSILWRMGPGFALDWLFARLDKRRAAKSADAPP